ncbi:hypothetical protein EVAR_44580_1 [Eumeta japonica]|uniref:Uncharacterized protein n=1 Tax=Eumeta variegata TaxID=151549 RepID=A0A4C1XBV1_EUMVA|nr:hypothetical protein EVAR_44580_1 [Eumeta japonica]
MKKEADVRTITWKFIPPGAPNMGGAWGVWCDLKTALAATLREGPREEVLHTLLLEAEHIVNSRPLTEVDIEPAEAEGLTPNHFLIGRSCGAAAGPLTTTCSSGLQTGARVSPRRSLLAEVVERITDSGAPPGGDPICAGRERHRADRRLIITSILVASRQN